MEPELLYSIYVIYYKNQQYLFNTFKQACDFISKQEIDLGGQLVVNRFMIAESDYNQIPAEAWAV